MRDCSRPEVEESDEAVVKLMPLVCPGTSHGKMSVESVNTDKMASRDSTIELPVQAGGQKMFCPAMSSQPGSASSSTQKHDKEDSPMTPQAGKSNWFQFYQKSSDADQAKESPRFEEVSAGKQSPRENAGGEAPDFASSPDSRASPRDTPRPMESPRAPDEGGREQTEELSYEGTYLGTMKHGRGKLKMPNYTYEGEFERNHKHGVGSLQWDDGRRFDGGFRHGKFHGAAVMIWPDKRKYVGQYEDDKKHGEGTFSWQDGRRYAGQWVAGKRQGVGTYTNAKGSTRRGTWSQDRPIQWEEAPVEESPRPKGASAGTLQVTSKPEIFVTEKSDLTDRLFQATDLKGVQNEPQEDVCVSLFV